MQISNCNLTDADAILELYDEATRLQQSKGVVPWPKFEKAFVENEIDEKRQWKICEGETIVCNWAITFSDQEIWGEKDQNNSIFIHRICVHPSFRGNRYIDMIVDWAKSYAQSLDKQYVRLDTLGGNTRLIQHYTSAGFDFLGIFLLTETANLPEHYQLEPNCCLFEIDLNAK